MYQVVVGWTQAEGKALVWPPMAYGLAFARFVVGQLSGGMTKLKSIGTGKKATQQGGLDERDKV
jgi:hypothetical protein